MRLMKFKLCALQSVPFANHFVILLMSRWRAIFATEYVSVSASTPIQYSPANAPLVETRKKGHSQIPLKMSYTYQYICCIPVAYVLHSM